MRVLRLGGRSQRISKSQPLKGATSAEKASVARLDGGAAATATSAKAIAFFVIAKRGEDFLDQQQ